MKTKTSVMDAADIKAAIIHIKEDIITRHSQEQIVLLGISDIGYCLAQRLANSLESEFRDPIPVGQLDISLYLPTTTYESNHVQIKKSNIPCSLRDKIVILVNGCVQSGQSIIAAMNALSDYEEARCVEVAVLYDTQQYRYPVKVR